ncbi:hypothetical protein NL676_038279 [Syzygium grande]|nr:hypothetical protein NL676_038279 [Syzygium grande]
MDTPSPSRLCAAAEAEAAPEYACHGEGFSGFWASFRGCSLWPSAIVFSVAGCADPFGLVKLFSFAFLALAWDLSLSCYVIKLLLRKRDRNYATNAIFLFSEWKPRDREGFAVWSSASSNLPATLDAKRAVRDARRAAKAADDAYLAQSYKVLYRRSTVVVHNVDEILALVELLAYAPPHYRLRWVEVRGPVPVGDVVDPLVKEMRDMLEANGFKLLERNTYSFPPHEDQA